MCTWCGTGSAKQGEGGGCDVIWAILVWVGVPLWLCAVGIGVLVFRSRRLRSRPGDIPVRVLPAGRTRWIRGHAIWVSDVFAWRGSPASWTEALMQVTALRDRPASPAEMAKLHRMGGDLGVVELSGPDGETVTVVAAGTDRAALLGPFTAEQAPKGSPPREAGQP
jgi:hypothetical protein